MRLAPHAGPDPEFGPVTTGHPHGGLLIKAAFTPSAGRPLGRGALSDPDLDPNSRASFHAPDITRYPRSAQACYLGPLHGGRGRA